jgi:hypothetical protein
MTRPPDKLSVEIEKLLRWAYQDELSKRYTSSAEGIWDGIAEIGWLGGIDADRGSPQRYDFGEPDKDAERIEKAVGGLADIIFDWDASRDAVMGELAPLAASRDMLLVRPFKTAALVTMHAKMGTRPDWHSEPPRPCMVEPEKGPKNRGKVVGECRGKDHYTTGSYSPLRWEPSPLSIGIARLEYAAWHSGLCILVETLELARHAPLPPAAPAQPWHEREPVRQIFAVGERSAAKLPLRPERERAGPSPRRGRRAGPVKKIAVGRGAG